MTMLEKMARALCAEDGYDPDWFPADDDTETPFWSKYVPDARAALQAIREPDDEAVTSVWPVGRMFQNRAAFTAMIDAILSGEA